MATRSPCSSPWKRMTNRSLDLASSTSSFNSSIVFTSHTTRRNHKRLITFSVDPPSSKTVSSDIHSAKKRVGRSGKSPPFGDDSKIESRDRTSLNFKSLFGKRTLWKRILFASTKVRSILLLNVITVVYASNIPIVKEVEAIMDPAAFTVVRFSIAAIPFIPFVLQARGDARTRNSGIELGVWLSLGYIMQAHGLLTSDAGRASFISMFTVIVVPLLDGLLGAVIPARTWFGALMSLVGVALLESSGSPPTIGDLYNFMGALFFGIHMLRTEHISRKIGKENFLSLLGHEVCVVAGLSALWYFLGGWFDGVEESNPSSWEWTVVWNWMTTFPWIPALYTGLFSTVLCLWVEMAAMCDVSATETAIIYGLEPVWGAGFAWFLLGERWGTLGWIGAALVLGGSLTVQILGSSSSTLSGEDECLKQKDQLLASDKRNSFSISPVVVSSTKDAPDILKK